MKNRILCATAVAAATVGLSVALAPSASADPRWGPDYQCSNTVGAPFSASARWLISPYGTANLWCGTGFHGSVDYIYQIDPAGKRHTVDVLFDPQQAGIPPILGIPAIWRTN